jgi:thiamine biosynthesis protein ThiS
MVVAELNGEIVHRSRFPETLLGPGDVLEIVHFVGGGQI